MVNIGYVQNDRVDISKFDIFSETERTELFAIFDQKEKDYLEVRKNMTKEEEIKAVEKLDVELEQIFEQFKDKAMKRQQKIATA